MRGRQPSGPEYVERLEGSAQAKRRAKVILETLRGRMRVQQACALLGISEQRFGQLREKILQAMVAELEAKPAGRPPHEEAPADSARLREKIAELEMELQGAQLREEIAVAFPHLVQREAEKKTPPRLKRQARPGWWKKK